MCVRVCVCVSIRGTVRAAGVTWTSHTTSAPWATRFGHTTVIDAVSGAIYVIGGWGSTTIYHDVWVSTDGGARPDFVKGELSAVFGELDGSSGESSGCLAG